MMICEGFDEANEKRRQHEKKLRKAEAKKINNKIKYFIKKIENDFSLKKEDKVELLDELFKDYTS